MWQAHLAVAAATGGRRTWRWKVEWKLPLPRKDFTLTAAERKIQELRRYLHTATGTNTAGAASSLGQSMHKTPSVKTPPALHPSSACSATSPRSLLLGRAVRGASCGFLVPREYGTQLTSNSSGQCGGKKGYYIILCIHEQCWG